MIPGVIATRYAKALLELGKETGELARLCDDMARLADTYVSSAELRDAVESPLVSPDAKRAIVQEIAEKLETTITAKNTVSFLCDRRRMRALPGIAQALRELADAHEGVIRAEVATARPLDAAYLAKLQAQLERVTGRKVVLDTREDPALLAGVVARVGDRVFDGSLLSRLRQLREAMLPN